MKRPGNQPTLQLNLPLLNLPAMTVPDDKQRELSLALVDLLSKAACVQTDFPVKGGEDEPEAHA